MLNRYDVLGKLTVIGECTGKFIIWLSMIAGCILLWYFVIAFIINS